MGRILTMGSAELPERYHIYALCEPGPDGAVRYVGKTTDPKRRLESHIRCSSQRRHHSERWIAGLIQRGAVPVMCILEVGIGLDWREAERWWIAEYKRRGARLTNVTDGGKAGPGMRGKRHTAETRARIAASGRGKRRTDETRARCSEAQRNRSPEHQAKITAAHRGKKRGPLSEETRRKISEALRVHLQTAGRPPPTEETRRKMSEARRGKKHSAETRAKIGDAHRGMKRPDGTGKKIGDALRGREREPFSDETRAKMRAAQQRRRQREREERAAADAAEQVTQEATQ